MTPLTPLPRLSLTEQKQGDPRFADGKWTCQISKNVGVIYVWTTEGLFFNSSHCQEVFFCPLNWKDRLRKNLGYSEGVQKW